jgi:FkbM family methyltransferase
MGFYQRGWTGITVEPDPAFARLQREQRPLDIQVEAAVTPQDGGTVAFHVVDGTGLSTLDPQLAGRHERGGYRTHEVEVRTRRLDRILEEAGWKGREIHFMCVDTEGSERGVLESLDLTDWRPWILVVEATEPNSTVSTRDQWEDLVSGAGYRFCLFDGLSCFYVAAERADELAPALGHGPTVLDGHTTPSMREAARLGGTVAALVEDVAYWRSEAVGRWADVMADRSEVEALSSELADLRGRHHVLGTDHHELSQRHHELSQAHHRLSGEHRELEERHRELEERHRELAAAHAHVLRVGGPALSAALRASTPLRRARALLDRPGRHR